MRPVTVIRALLWIGVAVSWWALNLRWGADLDVGSGPPAQLERLVVGSALLVTIAALALSVSGRGAVPPASWAKGIAVAAALAALGCTLMARSQAVTTRVAHVLQGPGWPWMLVGAGLATGCALAAWGLRRPPSRQRRTFRR